MSLLLEYAPTRHYTPSILPLHQKYWHSKPLYAGRHLLHTLFSGATSTRFAVLTALRHKDGASHLQPPSLPVLPSCVLSILPHRVDDVRKLGTWRDACVPHTESLCAIPMYTVYAPSGRNQSTLGAHILLDVHWVTKELRRRFVHRPM
jgi:hypothetical protein